MIEECDYRAGVRHGLEDAIEGPSFPVNDLCAISRCSTRQATFATFDHVEEVLRGDEAFFVGRGSMILRLLVFRQGFLRVSRLQMIVFRFHVRQLIYCSIHITNPTIAHVISISL